MSSWMRHLHLLGFLSDCRPADCTYSGGQFQRLLIAFALLGTPTVLMLDEPSAGVDERGQEQVTALINRVRAERGSQSCTSLMIFRW